MLGAYRKERGTDPERLRVVEAIPGLLEAGPRVDVDIERLASWWLQLVRPEWTEHPARPRIPRPAQLTHVRRRLRDHPVATERLAPYRDVVREDLPLDRRVVAAIVGLRDE